MIVRAVVCVTLICLAMASAADAKKPPPVWPVFVPGSSWTMTSDANGHTTTFGVRPLTRWGCWTGAIVDLWDVKEAPEDYWWPGAAASGHQILLGMPDGGWRMIGTYTESADPALVWTMQIHAYPGLPTPYVIVPGRQLNSDTVTSYFTLFTQGHTDDCIAGGDEAAPEWGRHVFWRSRFTFSGDVLAADYEEGICGVGACQAETWTFLAGLPGIDAVTDTRLSGQPLGLHLTRRTRTTLLANRQ